jgi:hypothetical protein
MGFFAHPPPKGYSGDHAMGTRGGVTQPGQTKMIAYPLYFSRLPLLFYEHLKRLSPDSKGLLCESRTMSADVQSTQEDNYGRANDTHVSKTAEHSG